mmetsp:Transcript_45546/g.142653  ORF Transcript_45546/g.142653 Transcript_45546/m.142653 type:complete len:651 (-) Transcript_45546:121-2073(-)
MLGSSSRKMAIAIAAALALALCAVPTARGQGDCNELQLDFIMIDGDATLQALEDDIVADLAEIGVTVTTRLYDNKTKFNNAMTSGDFHLAFSETWGPPYDPHSYAASWSTPDEAYYAALSGLPEPNTQEAIADMVAEVLTTTATAERQEQWADILTTLHSQATEIPFSGKSIPAVFRNRLSGYVNGLQQFEYRIDTLRVVTGSKNITLVPAGQGGLFNGVGRMDPHSYRPNEFYPVQWVYEGLVKYGPDGAILPALATSWDVEAAGDGQKYTFHLREGVTFHDGADFDCSVVKLNFDHFFAGGLVSPDYHGWYGLPGQVSSTECESDFVFVLYTADNYYPTLQELTYTRPTGILSPNAFVGGAASDPYTQNSCPVGWGTIVADGYPDVTCAGITQISGTGKWKFISQDTETVTVDGEEQTQTNTVLFERNANHWDASTDPSVVEFVTLVRYDSHEDVKNALLEGTLDGAVGDGVLDPEDVALFQSAEHEATFNVHVTDPMQNRIIIMNTAKAPTDDIDVRRALIHAVNKAAIIDRELAGLDRPVDALFPKNAPYCDLDLTPRADYDLQKALFLNCPETPNDEEDDDDDDNDNISTAGVAVIVIMGVLLAVFVGVFFYMRKREISGEPIFQPLMQHDPDTKRDEQKAHDEA